MSVGVHRFSAQRQRTRELRWMTRTVDGCRWRARVATAPRGTDHLPIVLVHGFGISSSYFVPLAERLASCFDVYAPDLPGHGRSATPERALDVRAFAAALHAWLAVIRIERASLVANSMGCQIAAELAARHRELVSRAVMIGPTLDCEARSFLRVLPRFSAGGLHERLSMTPLLVRDYLRMGTRLPAEFRAMVAHKIEKALPQVTAPVLFVRGEHDAIAPQLWVERLVSATPISRLTVVRHGGHAVHYGRPDDTLRVVVPFLQASEQRALSAGSATSGIA